MRLERVDSNLFGNISVWFADDRAHVCSMPSMELDDRNAAMIKELLKYNALKAKMAEV